MPSATPAHEAAPALAVKALLRTDEGFVAAELAERAGIGQSTARKALAALEAAGSARRVERGTGQAAAWYADSPTTAPGGGEEPQDEARTDQPDDPAEQSEGTGNDAQQKAGEPPLPGEEAGEGDEPAPPNPDQDQDQDQAAPGAATPARTRRSSVEGLTAPALREGRLGHGELGVIVLEAFALNPGVVFTAPRLARLVGRSSGAITNQLVKLSGEAILTQVAETPATYADARAPKPV